MRTTCVSSSSTADRPARLALAALCLCACLFGAVAPARADLRICNTTGSRVGIAIGYLDGQTWVTEGWFNLKPNLCEIVIRGQLTSRYYYLHGIDYDRGGEWSGNSFLCTRETEFVIRETKDCYARGYERSGFQEIDTGRQADWTIELGEGGLITGAAR